MGYGARQARSGRMWGAGVNNASEETGNVDSPIGSPIGRPKSTRIIGHRGASSAHRENTLEAFRGAFEQGADGIELDVRLSADDVLIVHHDAHLADGRLIRQHVAAELPEFVPTLGQVLEVIGDGWVNVEIKNVPGEPDYDDDHQIAVAVAGLMAAHLAVQGQPGEAAVDRLVVSSFNVGSIDRLQAIDPALPIGLLVWAQADPASLVARAAAHRFAAIHPHDVLVDQAFVDRAHAEGLQVNVWTVDDPERIRQLVGFGVDGIITNDPARALAALGRRSSG